ncbi:hypothetical protein DXG01_010445 [Tephrocybe rancida]|nr:hypothetical protein DXG01_010445 [Tephrocybe rancida]
MNLTDAVTRTGGPTSGTRADPEQGTPTSCSPTAGHVSTPTPTRRHTDARPTTSAPRIDTTTHPERPPNARTRDPTAAYTPAHRPLQRCGGRDTTTAHIRNRCTPIARPPPPAHLQ